MTDFNSELLRDIAVASVEDFLNKKVPLSQGLAKQAAAHDLNPEQIQRTVEAANTIAHLKIREITDDRTAEFPLAKFAEVMKLVTLPDEMLNKAAADQSVVEDDPTNAHGDDEDQAETETVDDANTTYAASIDDDEMKHRGEREKMAHFIREASINRNRLEYLNDRSAFLVQAMQKAASLVAKDPKGLDKLAAYNDSETFKPLSILVFGEEKQHRDFGEQGKAMFKEAEMIHVKTVSALYSEARELVREQSMRRDMDKRASALEGEFTKQAGVAGGVGYGMGRAAGGMARGAVMAPMRGAGNMAARGINSAAGKMGAGPVLKNVPKAPRIGALGALGAVASVGLDAAMYSPGVDAESGQSKDVWSALQQS
jgi:hypothetical protein